MQKIAFFNIDYSMGGGVERVTSDLIDLFLEKGRLVTHVFTMSQQNKTPAVQFKEDLEIIKVGSLNKQSQQNNFVEKLRDLSIDVLIYQADNMSISLAILECARKAKIKAIGHYHGSPHAYLYKYADAQHSNWMKIAYAQLVFPFKKNKLKRFLMKSHDGVVCVSKSTRLELERLFPNDNFRLSTILNPQRFSKEKNEPVAKKNIITLISRLEVTHKNVFLAALAWEKIANKNKDWKFRFLGTGSLEEEMKTFFRDRKIKNVEFLGFCSNVGELLKESSIGVSTSNCEGFSMAVLEYILTGNAVVSTDSEGGVHDMIINDKTGILVPKNDAERMAKGIEDLIIDTGKRDRFQRDAIKRIHRMYRSDIFDNWMKLIN